MKATTTHRSQTSVMLIFCTTLFIVTHCQQGLNYPESHQNIQNDDSLEEIDEKKGHFSEGGEQYQGMHIQSSVQHNNVDLHEDNPKSKKLVPSKQLPPHTDGSELSPSNTELREADRHPKLVQTSQTPRQFSSHPHQHSGSQHNQQQQQQHANQPTQGEQYDSQNHHSQQQLHQQRHTQQPQHEHFSSEEHFHEEQKQQNHHHFNVEQQIQHQQQVPQSQPNNVQHADRKYQQNPSSQRPYQQIPPAEQVPYHKPIHEHIPPPEQVLIQESPRKQMPPTEQVSHQEPPHKQIPPAEQVENQERHSFWAPGHPQQLKEEMGAESPQYKSNAGNQAIVPPILPEKDGDDFDPVDNVDVEEKEGEEELTPEEKAAEELFLAGEKLINATYYKEYHEAYLNFLEASKLNHQRAKEYVAFGYLFGDYLPQNVTKSAQLFEELASKGSPRAQMGLAFMYSAGFFYNSSQAKALIYSTFGALGGDPLAQMALGYRYYAGIGVESTCETALTYYRKVATKVADSVTLAGGPVVQRISLQDEAENVGTNNSPMLDDDLLQYYHFLADKGDQQAQVVLGTLYYQGGKGVQINHEQAYHYFSTASESGSGHALGYLGKMHSEGSPFIKQNNQTAFEFFKKSSEKSNHIGQAGLGMMYLNGLGVEKDVTKAFRYFSLASDQGSVDGQLQLGIMYFSGNGVRTDYKLAVKYFTMASQKGHVLAYYNLAQMHATGTGVLRNCHTAVELFKNVAERGKWSEMMMDAHRMYHEGNVDTALVKYMFLADLGYEVAQSNVAYLLDSGATPKFNVHESHQRALLQYSRAASQGSTLARLKMGDYYYYGLGTDVDYESAASHYRMASEQQNNAQAMFNLGYMHERGLGLKQDVHLAKRFYDMAAETSTDAHVPVTMALFKLGLLYGVDVFSKEFEGISGVLSLLDPMAYLGPQWDLFLASALVGFVFLIYIMRRMR